MPDLRHLNVPSRDFVRVLVGSVIAAVALAGATYLHSGGRLGGTSWRISNHANDRTLLDVSSTVLPGDPCNPHAAGWHNSYGPACVAVHRRAPWQAPTALFIAVLGVGAGIGVILKH